MTLDRRDDPARRSEDEIRAVAPLAARYADETLTRTVQGVHEAVAARAFEAVGPAGKPARVAHDTIAKGLYGTLRAGGRMVGQIASTVASPPRNEDGEPDLFSDHRVGAPTLAAINGLIGDKLVEEGNALGFEMTLRQKGRRIAVQREELALA